MPPLGQLLQIACFILSESAGEGARKCPCPVKCYEIALDQRALKSIVGARAPGVAVYPYWDVRGLHLDPLWQ